jgi:CBS-domain-containing membrane protein
MTEFPRLSSNPQKHNTTLDVASRTLAEAGILSAPVLAADRACVGMLDANDICAYVFGRVPTEQRARESKFDRLLIREQLRAATVLQALDASGKNPLVPIYQHDSAVSVVKLFGAGLERVLVYDAQNKVVRCVTQSDIVRFVHARFYEPALEEALRERPMLGATPLRFHHSSVSTRATVWDCIRRLQSEGGGALPILNDADGKIAGSFSAIDLRGIFEDRFPKFDQTIANFQRTHNPLGRPSRPITLHSSVTWKDIIDSFVMHRMHQVFVVDARERPMALISMTDLCHFLATQSNDHMKATDLDLLELDTTRLVAPLTPPSSRML